MPGIRPSVDMGGMRGYMGFSGRGIGLYKGTLGYNLPTSPSVYPYGLITFLPYYFGLNR